MRTSRIGVAVRMVLAALLALAFCLSLSPSLLLGGLHAVLFDSSRMTTLLTDGLVRSGALSNYAVAVLSEKVGGGAPISSRLTQGDWSSLVQSLFPASWQDQQIVANMNQFYAWLDTSDPVPAFSLSLTEIKAGLQGADGRLLTDALINSWPPCSAQQLQTYVSGVPPKASLPLCRPPEPYLGQLQQSLGQQINAQARQLPESLALTQPTTGSGGADTLKIDLRLLRDFGPVAWLFPLALLLLEVAVAARSLRGLLGWIGFPLAVGALFGVILVLIVSVLRARGLISLVDVPAALRASAISVLGLLLQSVFGRLLIECSVLLILGFVLVVLMFTIRPSSHAAVAAGPSTPRPSTSPAPPAVVPPSQAGSSSQPASRPTSGKETVILPKEAPPSESSEERTPPRGIFG